MRGAKVPQSNWFYATMLLWVLEFLPKYLYKGSIMKKIITMSVVGLFMLALLSTTGNAATCSTKFMKDPCPLDGYSIVNTERFIRGRHNWMHDIHHFWDAKKTVHRKRVVRKRRTYRKRVHHKRRYRYVKRCRRVKVRL